MTASVPYQAANHEVVDSIPRTSTQEVFLGGQPREDKLGSNINKKQQIWSIKMTIPMIIILRLYKAHSGLGLPTDCQCQFHLSADRGKKQKSANLEMKCGQIVEPQAVVGFLHQDYRYKSAAIKISHNPGNRTWDRCVRDSNIYVFG